MLKESFLVKCGPTSFQQGTGRQADRSLRSEGGPSALEGGDGPQAPEPRVRARLTARGTAANRPAGLRVLPFFTCEFVLQFKTQLLKKKKNSVVKAYIWTCTC